MRSGKLLVAAALSIAGIAACFFGGAPLLAQAETEQPTTTTAAWEFEPTENDGQVQQINAEADLFEPIDSQPRELRRTPASVGSEVPEKPMPLFADGDETVGGPATADQPETSFGPLDAFQPPVEKQQKPEPVATAPETKQSSDTSPGALFDEMSATEKSDVFGEEEEDLFDTTESPAPMGPRTGVSHRSLQLQGSLPTAAAPKTLSNRAKPVVEAPVPQPEAPATAPSSVTPQPVTVATPPQTTVVRPASMSRPEAPTDAVVLPNPISPPAPLALPVQPVSRVMDITASTITAPIGPCVNVEVKTDGTVAIGQECQCAFVVRNSGSAAASNVVLEAWVPDEVKLTAATPQPSDASTLTWPLGDLRAGEERTVRLRLMPNDTGKMSVRAAVRYSGQSEVAFNVVKPMLKIALAGPEQVQVGEAAPYVVTVSNPGSGVAQDVVISARVPEGLEHRRGKHLTMQIGALSPGKSRNVRLALMAVEPGKHPLKVEAVGGTDLSDVTSASVHVVAPMLALQIDGPKVRHAGRKSRYAVVVSNPGNVTTSNVRAKYRMPEGFDFVEADRGGRVAADGTIEWFVGQLTPGETTKFNVTLRAKRLGEFVHQAGVVSEHGAQKAAEWPTRIEGVTSLALTIQDRDDPVEVGQETLYEIRVANEGSKDASNVVVSCDVPAGMKVKSIRCPVEHSTRNGRLIFDALTTLPKGKAVVYQVIVTASAGGSQRLRAQVTSDSVRQPLTSEELTKVYND